MQKDELGCCRNALYRRAVEGMRYGKEEERKIERKDERTRRKRQREK
jgi:hypothetical protein